VSQIGLETLSTEDRLQRLAEIKHGPDGNAGWDTTLRMKFGHYTPNDYYESCVESLVDCATRWIDVGGGDAVFPSNPRLARLLADRCARLVAVDPSSNVNQNVFAHERHRAFLEDFEGSGAFDLATMRMVVEHVARPEQFVANLARLVRPGGKAIVYTVNRWAPVTLISSCTPMWFHHAAKKVLWRSQEKDTFPVVYAMNTRSRLNRLFSSGFREIYFRHLDDCRTLARWRFSLTMELALWKALTSLRLRYPETCLLGVYQRT
jgi:SAM-dependent methyltransferase